VSSRPGKPPGCLEGATRQAKTRSGRGVGWLGAALAVAFVIRGGLLLVNLHENERYFRATAIAARRLASEPGGPHLAFGYEPANIACALVCGHEGLASPFGGQTGPTGWSAPGIVAVYAAGFAMFGCFSLASVGFAFAVMMAMSLATVVIVGRLAFEVFHSDGAGRIAAFFFAVAPYDFWQFGVKYQADLDIVTFFFALLLLLVVRYAKQASSRRLVAVSVASGAALLFFPGFAAASVLTFAAALLAARPSRWGRDLALCAAIQLLIIGPYILLQRQRLGGWTFIKSNAPFEIYLGNLPEAHGVLTDEVYRLYHPGHSPAEYQRYAKAGELRYVDEKFGEFRQRFNPSTFARSTLNRLLHFFFLYANEKGSTGPLVIGRQALWVGFGLVFVVFAAVRRGRLNALEWMIYLQTAGFALPYMVTDVTWRYRVPITPAVVVLAAGFLVVIARRLRSISTYTRSP
jgi:hypothetical protein